MGLSFLIGFDCFEENTNNICMTFPMNSKATEKIRVVTTMLRGLKYKHEVKLYREKFETENRFILEIKKTKNQEELVEAVELLFELRKWGEIVKVKTI